MRKSYIIIALIVIIVIVGGVGLLNRKSEKDVNNSQNVTNIVKNNTNINIAEPVDEITSNIIATPTENEIQ